MKISIEDAKEMSKDILASIEAEYQCPIARLAYFKRGAGAGIFRMGVVFEDYRILDATIIVTEEYGFRRVTISGSVV